MNETILQALMRLFAIIANVNSEHNSQKARSIVKSYLQFQLNEELVDIYLSSFDEYLENQQHRHKEGGRKARKRTSLNSVKVLMICEQINAELLQQEKIIVVIRLLEFLRYSREITEKERDFINTVADIFLIARTEYENISAFILDSFCDLPQIENLLLVDAKKIESTSKFEHIYNENLDGTIGVLHIESTNTFIFRYQGKTNLYLKSHNIEIDRTYIFGSGATIRSSKIKPIYYSDVAAKFIQAHVESKTVLTARDMVFQFKGSKNGIQKFSFSEESGQLLGVMGGSGVGKSTFLNVLIGNLKLKSGSIKINGYDIFHDKKKLEGVVGYVPQDDLLIEELTVFQNLYFNAKLCFDGFSEQKIIRTVIKVLIDLDLNAIRNLKVGDSLNKFISGGQRKRVNIALELMREPSILIVDEPTSGLSSMDSEIVMNLLKEQSNKGKLVIVNIHQPSSDIFKMFDRLFILDRGGYPVYYGNPIDAVVYFKKTTNHVNAHESECTRCGNVNPEQILQILEAKVVNEHGKYTRTRKIKPQQWYSMYKKKLLPNLPETDEKIPLVKNSFKVPSIFSQFKIFSLRNLLSKLTNRQYLLITFLEAPILAIILGYFTKFISGTAADPNLYVFRENENIPAYLFMAVIVSLFLGLTVSAEEIIRDRRIQLRESFLNLSRISYLNSKIILLLAISAIQSLSFVLIGNLILGVAGMNFYYWLVLFSTSVFANMVGLNISSALNSVVNIYILIPFILVPQLLLSGVIVDFSKLHKSVSSDKYVPFVGDLMASRWAYEALAVVQFSENKFEQAFFEVEKKVSYANFMFAYVIPRLREKLFENRSKGDKKMPSKNGLELMKNELTKINQLPENQTHKYMYLDSLSPEKMGEKTFEYTKDYLKKLRNFYKKMQNKASVEKDNIFEQLVKKYGGRDAVYELQNHYHNKRLAEMVLKKQDLQRVVEHNNRLIQTKTPVLKIPDSNWGRAHFYAPEKHLFGLQIPTLWFNVLVLWLFILVLYFTLWTDFLRNLFHFLENFKNKFKK